MNQPTLRRRLVAAVLTPLAACAGFAGVWSFHRTPVVDVVRQGPVAPSPTARLLTEHHCWTRHAPRHADGTQVLPSHAVVTRSGDDHPTYGGRAVTRLALDHVLHGTHPDLLVSGFCR